MTFTNLLSLAYDNCYYIFSLYISMPSKKSKKKFTPTTIQANLEKETAPRTAKIVLFVFGVGPLLLMCVFLFSNGFFNTP